MPHKLPNSDSNRCSQVPQRALAGGRPSLLILVAATAVLIAAFANPRPVGATADLFAIDGQPVVLSAVGQNREEVWNWFNPGTVKGGLDENQYHFLGSWIRVGARYELDGIRGFAELMSPFFINLPNSAIAPPPKGLLGLGANYFQPHRNSNDAGAFLKQGYLEFGRNLLEGLDFKGGRFEFFDGAEYQPRELDPELKWLLLNRIAQRLLANFGFSDVMRSFDGAAASYGNNQWQATLMYGVPTKGVFDVNGMDEIRNLDVAYASFNAGPEMFASDVWGNSLFRVFYIYYNDTRGVPLVDNKSSSGTNADSGAVSIDTLGADYVRTLAAGPGVTDFLIWTAGQFGSWGNQSQRAYAVAAEAGYRFEHVSWKPWLRGGYTVGSGDGNPHDSTHSTFFQILPTPRLYAFFPFFNMMNLDDAMGQLILDPRQDVQIQTSIHGLRLDSSRDLWYSGGGAFNNKLFGYAGRPSLGRNYLATLADCQINWTVNRHVALQFYYGHAFGGNVVGAIYRSGREGDYGFIQVTWTL
jgi:alginate export protein